LTNQQHWSLAKLFSKGRPRKLESLSCQLHPLLPIIQVQLLLVTLCLPSMHFSVICQLILCHSRKQALQWHPDKNPEKKEEAETRFKIEVAFSPITLR